MLWSVQDCVNCWRNIITIHIRFIFIFIFIFLFDFFFLQKTLKRNKCRTIVKRVVESNFINLNRKIATEQQHMIDSE